MRYHTLEDGVTPDSRITSASFDEWWHTLGPPRTLLGDWYKRGLRESPDGWQIFSGRYTVYLQKPKIAEVVQGLALMALDDDVTILCCEPCADRCHRSLLAEECLKYKADLRVIHRLHFVNSH